MNTVEIKQKMLELCWKIEKLPASDLQTEISVMASELLGALEQASLLDAELTDINTALDNAQVPFTEGNGAEPYSILERIQWLISEAIE